MIKTRTSRVEDVTTYVRYLELISFTWLHCVSDSRVLGFTPGRF